MRHCETDLGLTLIVLIQAGLFSAILTAFLIASLVLLQPDNSQTSVQILSLIALQNGVPGEMQPFLNDTAQSLPTSTTFIAPTDAVSINTLWFTSLVLSLAAALFGILAKQWCREYLRWHSSMSSARENVLIRQVRFEAWERWQVASFVASIPAFLEVALILFLVGLLIFVPTFAERSLTIVASVVIASTLFGFAILTVLPVFYRLCPFQTPTGWAFVRLAGPTRALPSGVIKWLGERVLTGTRGGNASWFYDLWARWGIQPRRPERLSDWRKYGLWVVEDPDLCTPAVPNIGQACREMGVTSSAAREAAAVDAVQTSVLTRALTWIRRGYSDEVLLAAIRDCVPSIHIFSSSGTVSGTGIGSGSARQASTLNTTHFLSAIHAICPIDLCQVHEMLRWFITERSDGSVGFAKGPTSTSKIEDYFGPYVDMRGEGPGWMYPAVCEAWEDDTMALEVKHALIRFDLETLVGDWLTLLAEGARRRQVEKRRKAAGRIVLLLTTLRMLPTLKTLDAVREAGVELTRPWVECLEGVYKKLATKREAYEDGLVPMFVELCGRLGDGEVLFERDGADGEVRVSGTSCSDATSVKMLTKW